MGVVFVCVFLPGLSYSQLVFSGSYAGNSTDDRSITGIGFTPDVVILKGSNNRESIIYTANMGSNTCKRMNGGAYVADGIQNIVSDGFEVGTLADVNVTGNTYYYTAFLNQANNFTSGTYTGNGVDNRAISIGFQPDFIYLISSGSEIIHFATKDMTSGDCCIINGNCALTGIIKSITTSGFTVGTATTSNSASRTYYWVAGKSTSNAICVGTYTGNATDDRDINLCGWAPDFLWIKANANRRSVWRNSVIAGDNTFPINGANPVTNRIQALNATGFQAGTNNEVNTNTTTYYYVAFGDVSSPLSVELKDFSVVLINGLVNSEWVIASELNVKAYELERSINGVDFQPIGHLPARNAGGLQSYSFIDTRPLSGSSWYRLKMIGQDESLHYSEKVLIVNSQKSENPLSFSLYPNPNTTRQLNLAFSETQAKNTKVYFTDLMGKVVFSHVIEAENANQNLEIQIPESLEPGVYFVRAALGTQAYTRRLILN